MIIAVCREVLSLFDLFTQKADENKKYEGLRLLAADGSDFLPAANPDDPDSFFPGIFSI